MIRSQDGFPPAYKTLPSFQEAKEWAIQEEARRRQGIYTPETFLEVVRPGNIQRSTPQRKILSKESAGKSNTNL